MRKVYLVTKDEYSSSDAIMAFESEDDAKMLKDSLDSRVYEVLFFAAEKQADETEFFGTLMKFATDHIAELNRELEVANGKED